MNKLILRFIQNDSGVTAIEYALLTAGITVIVIAGATQIGTSLVGTFTAIAAGF